MATGDQGSTPELGPADESCAGCGFPLATDQRYCLNCGTRRGGPRLDYINALVPAGAGAAAQLATPSPRASSGREASPLVAVAGVALLGLMLLVGVLVGRGGDDGGGDPAVVTVNSGAPAPVAAAPAATEDAGEVPTKSKDKGGGGGGEEPVEVSTDDLAALENTTGEAYQEASKKLPDTIATPGEAPPTDNVKPGGGSGATTIGGN